MKAKEYLKEYERQTYKIKIMEEQLVELNESIDSLRIRHDGMPRPKGPADRTGTMAIRLADLTADIAEARTNSLKLKNEIRMTIMEIDDIRLVQVLTERYVLLHRWEQIAVDLHYSWRYTLKLHDLGLREIQKILDNRKRT